MGPICDLAGEPRPQLRKEGRGSSRRTAWHFQRREKSISETTPWLFYGGQLLKSALFVGERSYSFRKAVTSHPRR